MQVSNIKFGTDGWRGLIAADFTYDNAALAATAIVSHLSELGLSKQPLLIGYDRRFSAELYAAHLANHCSRLGQPVILSTHACPTPAIAVGVLALKAAGAIMLTASHNPFHYQGLKFIPDFAGPAMPETTDRITALIQQLAPGFSPPALDLSWAGESIDLHETYFAALDKLVDADALLLAAKIGIRPYYTAMHGVGAGYLDAYLAKIGVDCRTTASERDVYFGGALPDPSPGMLSRLIEEARAAGSGVVIGTDGDADRFGLVDQDGRYFGANDALPMLADYLIRERGMRGSLVRTVATSHLLDGLADWAGLELVETAVGFKYVGNEMRKGALVGGEESGGLSIQGHVPEKDGILACLLMLEMASKGESWSGIMDRLHSSFGARAYKRMDEHIDDPAKSALIKSMDNLDSGVFCGRRVTSTNKLDGVKLTFDDGSWMLLRASGTEPVVRIYVEVTDPDSLERTCSEFRSALLSMTA